MDLERLRDERPLLSDPIDIALTQGKKELGIGRTTMQTTIDESDVGLSSRAIEKQKCACGLSFSPLTPGRKCKNCQVLRCASQSCSGKYSTANGLSATLCSDCAPSVLGLIEPPKVEVQPELCGMELHPVVQEALAVIDQGCSSCLREYGA